MSSNGVLKVAMVEPIGGHSGNEFYDFGLCKAISEQGTPLVLYTCDRTDLDTRFEFPFQTIKPFRKIYGSDPKVIRGLRYVRGVREAVRHASEFGANVAHFHVYHFARREFLNFQLFSRRGFKIVATIHDIESFDRYGKKINTNKYRKFEKLIDRIIVHSEYARDSLKKYFAHFPEDHIDIVPHGDSDFLYNKPISRAEAREALQLPQEKKIILFFGQIKKVKGLDVLLKAFVQVREKRKDALLLIAGRPWKVEQDEFDQIIKENDLSDSCVLNYSYIPNEKIPYYYAAADITVLPYREIYSSGVMVRSLDYGSAIVASDLDTFRRIIADGENGILFRSEDEKDLAEKIVALLSDEEKMSRLRVNARKTAEEKFSWSMIGKRMNEIYKLTLNGSGH